MLFFLSFKNKTEKKSISGTFVFKALSQLPRGGFDPVTQSIISGVRAVLPRRTSAPGSLPSLPIAGGWTVTQRRRRRGGREEETAPPAAAKKQHLIHPSPPSPPDHSEDRGQRGWPGFSPTPHA